MFDDPQHRRPPVDDAPQRRPTRPRSSGGIPDSLLIGGIALLLALALITWTATGLAGLLTHGTWPHGVTFSRTPMAMGALITEPRDLAGAWPGAHRAKLPGYGLFWGLFIGQFLVIGVLTLFAITTVTRARTLKAARRKHPATPATESAPQLPEHSARTTTYGQRGQQPGTPPEPAPQDAPAPAIPVPHSATEDSAAHLPQETTELATGPDARTRVLDAPGAALVATADRTLWADTKDARAKLGPVHLFDPTHLCETPNRLRWSPHHGCEDNATAAARATALLAPLRSPRPVDAEVHSTAETLLRCWLHAAALDGKPFRELHRWAIAKTAPNEPVQTLRTHTKAAAGAAGELEAALTSYPDRRRAATELIRSALAPLSQLHVRNACTAARADRIALESFINEAGTLYVVGGDPDVMPILNALTQCVVEHGRRMAGRSSPGRLDPPLTSVLDLPLPSQVTPPAVHQPNGPAQSGN